jgi:uncharacterized repeat protein (TIGR01451 family)
VEGFSSPAPALTVVSAHTGSFTQGQSSAAYAVTVSDAAAAGSTSGTVTVTETLPSGLTLVSMAGTGWTCPSGGNTCTRSDVLTAGASYAAIVVTATVAASATSPQVNSVAVSGGGSAAASATDSTTILASPVTYTIFTFAGDGSMGYGGDGGPATGAMLSGPVGVAADGAGNFYIADVNNGRVRKVTPAGTITTVAGGGGTGSLGDGGQATSASLTSPAFVTLDGSGNLYIADASSQRIRKVTPAGIITTVAGNGTVGYSGDGGQATSASIASPHGMAVDSAGNLYFADEGNNRVRKITPAGIITTVAGNGSMGYSGDGGQATSATLDMPIGVALDGAGDLYIGDSDNNRVRKVTPAGIISTVAGNGSMGYSGDGGPAASAELQPPQGVAVDGAGNLYIADRGNQSIRKVTAAGIIATIAGNGSMGYSGDGGPAARAELSYPSGVAVDNAGNVYIGDMSNNVVRVLRPSVATGLSLSTTAALTPGIAGVAYSQTLASGGVSPYTWLTLSGALPGGLSLSTSGVLSGAPAAAGSYSFTLWVADSALGTATQTYTLTVAEPAQLTVVCAHTGSFTQGQSGTYTVAVSNAASAGPASGTVTVTETAPGGLTLVSMAGTGWTCPSGGNTCTRGDGLAPGASYPAIAVTVSVASNATSPQMNTVAVSGGGSATGYGTDPTTILPAPALSIVSAHTGNFMQGQTGATYAVTVSNAAGVGPTSGAVTVTETAPSGLTLVSMAGTGWTCAGGGNTCTRSDALAGGGSYAAIAVSVNVSASVLSPQVNSVAVAGGGSAAASATDSTTILASPAVYTIFTFAGIGTMGYGGDGGPATGATLDSPAGVAMDGAGNLYVADTYNSRIRKVSTAGIITTVAGNGTLGYSGDGGQATGAELDYPQGVAVDGAGNLYIADTDNNRVRKVSTAGIITTVAGNGTAAYSGDGGQATGAEIYQPEGVAVDGAGNLYVADTQNSRVRKVSTAGIITTVAGNGTLGYSGDGGQATGAELYRPEGVAVDGAGNLYIADTDNNRVRKVSTAGIIATVAGNGTAAFSGDGGPAAGAELYQPAGVAVDGMGNLYIADAGNSRVREVSAADTITTIAGNGSCCRLGDGGPATGAAIAGPSGVTVDSAGNVYIGAPASFAVRVLRPGVATGLSVPTASLPAATVGAAYSQTLGASGGVAPYSWLLASGRLPNGLSLSGAGVVSGAPTANGNYGFTVWVIDSASGMATQTFSLTVNAAGTPAQLSIASAHSGSFTQGQSGATYAVTVSNAASAGPATGAVTVTETVPSGLTLVSMSGAGWTCASGANTCARSDGLAAGASFAAITVTVSVAANASSPQVNGVAVSGGGSATASATDSTTVVATQTIAFNPLNNVAYGVAPFTIGATASSNLTVSFSSNSTAVCTVSGAMVTILAVGTCSITASQSGNAQYEAAASVTRSFSVSGGGALNISGQVTLSSSPLSGVTVTLSGSQFGATTTDSGGNYSFTGLASGGNYATTPSLTGYAFTPQTTAFNGMTASQTANFTAAAASGSLFAVDTPAGSSTATNLNAAPVTTLTAAAPFAVPIGITLDSGIDATAFTFGVQITPNGSAPPLTGSLKFTTAPSVVDYPVSNAGGTSNSLGVVWSSFTNALTAGTQTLGWVTGSIPAGAQVGQSYTITVTGASATTGGSAQTPVPVSVGANRTIAVSLTYLAGDVAPYNSDTVGNFGDGILEIRDLIQELFAVDNIPGFKPSACSDRYDAMDLYPVDTPTARGGDGLLDIRDLILELFRVNNLDMARPVRASRGGACAGSSSSSGNAEETSGLDAVPRPQPDADGALFLGDPESTGAGTARVPVYLSASRNLANLALTFAAGDMQSQLRFVSVPTALPALVQDSQPGVAAVVWQGGITVAAGDRFLLGYVTGPSDALRSLRLFGASASSWNDDRAVRLSAGRLDDSRQ